MTVVLERVSAPSPEVGELIGELDAALSGPYAPEQRHALSLEQLFQPDIHFFLARLDGAAVGCGGVAICAGYAEVKRMYTKASVRGRGVARVLMNRIEAEARQAGAPVLRLETGLHQHDALSFYEAAGFRRRSAFGPYAGMPRHKIELSVFYEKPL
jgi:putative acetyltransferase